MKCKTKIVKALEDSDILMKRVAETFKNDVKKDSALPLILLLGILGVSLLSGRGLFRAGQGKGMYRAGQRKNLFRAGQGIKKKLLMLPHRLTNFEIKDYFKYEPRLNGVFSKR